MIRSPTRQPSGAWCDETALRLPPGGSKPALEVWAYVQSRPESGRTILTMGKRDVSYDASLPVPLHWYRPGAMVRPEPMPRGHAVLALNDQHCHLGTPGESPLQVGDMVGFGIGHPCTTFDKWGLLMVVDAGLSRRRCREDFLLRESGLAPPVPRLAALAGSGPRDLTRRVLHGLQRRFDHVIIVLDGEEPCAALQRAHAAAQEGRRESNVGGPVQPCEVAIVARRRFGAEAHVEDAGEAGDHGRDACPVEGVLNALHEPPTPGLDGLVELGGQLAQGCDCGSHGDALRIIGAAVHDTACGEEIEKIGPSRQSRDREIHWRSPYRRSRDPGLRQSAPEPRREPAGTR